MLVGCIFLVYNGLKKDEASQLLTRSNGEAAKTQKGAHLSLLHQRQNMKVAILDFETRHFCVRVYNRPNSIPLQTCC